MRFYCRCRGILPLPETHSFIDIVRIASKCALSLEEAVELVRILSDENDYLLYCDYGLASDDYSRLLLPQCHSEKCYIRAINGARKYRNRCLSI